MAFLLRSLSRRTFVTEGRVHMTKKEYDEDSVRFLQAWAFVGTPGAIWFAKMAHDDGVSLGKSIGRGVAFGAIWPASYAYVLITWLFL